MCVHYTALICYDRQNCDIVDGAVMMNNFSSETYKPTTLGQIQLHQTRLIRKLCMDFG